MTHRPVSTLEKTRAFPWLYLYTGATTLFVLYTIFGPLFPLFLSELGMPKTRIGLVLALPPFFGVVAIVVAAWARRTGVKKVFLVFFLLRHLSFALILLAPWLLGRVGGNTVFYWIVGIVAAFSL